MAKHTKRVKRNWQTIEIDVVIDIGTPGIPAKSLIAALISETADNKFIATSLEATYQLTVEQAAEPNSIAAVSFGVAKSDYSAAEVETWVENSSGFKRENLISQEISKRMIKQIGMFSPRAVTAAQQVVATINEGMPIKTRLNWRILANTTLLFWVYNGGPTAIVVAANQKVHVLGQLKGFWED